MTAARFWDRIAPRYARMAVRDPEAYAEKLRRTQARLRPDWDALEIGCGTGATAIAHAPHLRSLLAIDAAPRMIEIARGRAAEAGVSNVTFRAEDFADFDPPAESFDAVFALSLLHLLPDRDAALARIRAMLKPGGLFVSNTVCLEGWARLFGPVSAAGAAFGLLPRLRTFSAGALLASLERAGLAPEEAWRPGGPVVFALARKPG